MRAAQGAHGAWYQSQRSVHARTAGWLFKYVDWSGSIAKLHAITWADGRRQEEYEKWKHLAAATTVLVRRARVREAMAPSMWMKLKAYAATGFRVTGCGRRCDALESRRPVGGTFEFC
jgi:hypothetical protein